jgi:PAS domain S-box-containing protein
MHGMVGPTDDQTRALLQVLVECATVGIGFLDREHRFRYLNPTLALINGAAGPELVGRSIAEVFPGAAARVTAHSGQVLATGQPVVNVEYTRPAQSGDTARTWVADYFPVRGPDGATIGVGLIVVDVTERRRAQAARERPAEPASDELQRALRDARAHAHRINNQLSLAVGYGELLATRGDLEGEARDHLRQVVDALGAVGHSVARLQETIHRPDTSVSELPGGGSSGPA